MQVLAYVCYNCITQTLFVDTDDFVSPIKMFINTTTFNIFALYSTKYKFHNYRLTTEK